MTRAKRIACRLRWVLLVLWVLCLSCGVLWLFRVLFSEVGLIGGPSIAILGPLYYLIDDLDGTGALLLNIIYVGLFFATQWFFLCPREVWKVKVRPAGRPMKRAAVAAAFAITLLSIGLLYSVLDLFSDSIFDDLLNSSSTISSIIQLIFLIIPLVLWCFWSVIFCIYRRQSERYTWAGRVIRGLIGGSVLELFVAIPIYVTRQDDCYCARGSYAGLVFGATVLLWAFGPGVFLLFIREKQRREKLSDFQKSSETA